MASPTEGRTFYFHIGFPKTGTTFLQEEILPGLKGIDFLSKPRFSGLNCYPGYGGFGAVFGYSPAIWERLGRRFLEEVLGPEVTRSPLPLLVSDENVATALRYPSRYVNVDALPRPYDVFGIADHLREMKGALTSLGFSSVRLILTIRRQDTWLASAYAQDSHCWPEAGQRHFEKWVDEFLDPRDGYWGNGTTLDYDLVERVLSRVVATDDILILPYELLRDEPLLFMERWLDFMRLSRQAPEISARLRSPASTDRRNVRSRVQGSWELRPPAYERTNWGRVKGRVRRVATRATRAAGLRGRPRSIRLTPAVSSKVLAVFGESNRALSDRLGLRLETYGYHGPA